MKRIFQALFALFFIFSIKTYAQDSLRHKTFAGVIQPGTADFSLSTYPAFWFQGRGVYVNTVEEYGRCFAKDWAWSAGLFTGGSLDVPDGAYSAAGGLFGALKYQLLGGEKASLYGLVSVLTIKSASWTEGKVFSGDGFGIIPSYGLGCHYFVAKRTALTGSLEAIGYYQSTEIKLRNIITSGPPQLMLKIGVSWFYPKNNS